MTSRATETTSGIPLGEFLQSAILQGRYFIPGSALVSLTSVWAAHYWNSHHGWRAVLGVFLVLSTLALNVGWASVKEHAENKRDDANRDSRAENLTAMGAALLPALDFVDKACVAARMGDQVILESCTKEAEVGLMNAVYAICRRTASVRVIVFEVIRKPSRQVILASCQHTGGDGNDTKHRFDTSNEAGRAFWERALSGTVEFVDLTGELPRGFTADPSRSYKAFASCGIVDTEGNFYGCINVDAPDPEDLSESDLKAMEVLAHMLAATYTLSGQRTKLDPAAQAAILARCAAQPASSLGRG